MATRELSIGTAKSRRVPALPGIAVLTVVLVLVSTYALTQGAADIPVNVVVRMLLDRLPGVDLSTGVESSWERIVFEIRLPRILAAGAVGAALAVSGAAYQGCFRNPLADPYLLGVAAGAGLAVALAYVSPLPVTSTGFVSLPLFAFVGGMGTVLIVYATARSAASLDNGSLILAGVALSAVWGGCTSFVILNSDSEVSQPVLSFLFGGFNTISWQKLLLGAPYMIVGVGIVLLHARALNVLQLDEEQASHLGIDVMRTKLVLLAAGSLAAATAVALAGTIGFLGLIVPHAARLVFGTDFRKILPVTILGGAALLITVDLVARTVIAPQEVPVGVLTAILGGPFFIALLRGRRVFL